MNSPRMRLWTAVPVLACSFLAACCCPEPQPMPVPMAAAAKDPGGLPKFYRFKLTNNSGDTIAAPTTTLSQDYNGATKDSGPAPLVFDACNETYYCIPLADPPKGWCNHTEYLRVKCVTLEFSVGRAAYEAKIRYMADGNEKYLRAICADLQPAGGGGYVVDARIVYHQPTTSGDFVDMTTDVLDITVTAK